MDRSFLGNPIVKTSPSLERELSEEQKLSTIKKVEEAFEKNINFHIVADAIEDIFSRCMPDLTKEQRRKVMSYILPPKINVVFSIEKEDKKRRRADTNGIEIMIAAREFCNNGIVDIPLLLHVYIHEALHVIATERNSYESDGSFTTGVSLATEPIGQNEQIFYLYDKFNEALTELLADAIQTEYITRQGEAKEHKTIIFDEKALLIERPLVYAEERIVVEKVIDKIKKVSGFSYDEIVRSLVREYFTNGHLGREEIVQAFKGYPEVYLKLNKLGYNNIPTVSKAELEKYELNMVSNELDFVKALFGRDVIGQYNKKVVDSL